MRTYFHRLCHDTATSVWVNNPTPAEAELALEQGALGATTNPGYAANLLRRSPELVGPVLAEVAAACEDDADAAEQVQLALVGRIVEAFRPLYDETHTTSGFVSCQGSPLSDDDPTVILEEARRARRLGPNATPKIPATEAGLRAFEVLVAEGSPTIVTEVFSLAQLVAANERYLATTAWTRVRPPFFMSPITGIFGDHLKVDATTNGIEVDPALPELAGVVLTRACYELCQKRAYPVTLLAGGARRTFDLTGLAGARLHVTINWSTFEELIANDPGDAYGYAEPIDPAAAEALSATFPDVARALQVDGLAVEEFESFGPVRFFRDSFVAGWRTLMDAVAETRPLAATASRG